MVVAQIKARKMSPWQSALCYTCSGMYCVGSSTCYRVVRIHIPRLPPISLSGDHRPLLQFKPSELRQDLMDVVGFHLGLSPPGVDSSFAPSRLVADEVLSDRKQLQPHEIYIGPGHFSHRWPLSQWQNPFKAGEGRRVCCNMHVGSMTKTT